MVFGYKKYLLLLFFAIPVVFVALHAFTWLSESLRALIPVRGIALTVIAEKARVFNAWFWTSHNSFNSFNSCFTLSPQSTLPADHPSRRGSWGSPSSCLTCSSVPGARVAYRWNVATPSGEHTAGCSPYRASCFCPTFPAVGLRS